jgi:hypothetical protein
MLNKRYKLLFIALTAFFIGGCGGVSFLQADESPRTDAAKDGSAEVKVFCLGCSAQNNISNRCRNFVAQAAIEMLSEATDSLLMEVTRDRINKLLEGEKKFKVVFPAGKKIPVPAFKRQLDVGEIYIPLTGKFSGAHTTIFYVTVDGNEAGQYINTNTKKFLYALEKCKISEN